MEKDLPSSVVNRTSGAVCAGRSSGTRDAGGGHQEGQG